MGTIVAARTASRLVTAGVLGLLAACAAVVVFSQSAMGELGAWVRLHYVYPYPHVDNVIPLMAQGKILPYLDIPFQHASPNVLRRMRRPANDAKVLERPDVRDGLGRSLAECFRQGLGAATWDGVAVARGEGYSLTDIKTDVLIWHGEQDRNDPVTMARHQEQLLPHVTATYFPDDGHLIFFSRIRDILPGLIAD